MWVGVGAVGGGDAAAAEDEVADEDGVADVDVVDADAGAGVDADAVAVEELARKKVGCIAGWVLESRTEVVAPFF